MCKPMVHVNSNTFDEKIVVDQISHKNAYIIFLKEEIKANIQVEEIKKFPIREIHFLPNNIVEIPLEQTIKEESDFKNKSLSSIN